MALNLSGDAAAFLRDHHVMTLATQDPDGPWAAALFYALAGDDLVFLSAPSSRHAGDLARDSRCAATIQGQEQDWRCIQGVQIEGFAAAVRGAERVDSRRIYEERFPFVASSGASDSVAKALAKAQWYRLRVVRLMFIDNTRGFGQRQEFRA